MITWKLCLPVSLLCLSSFALAADDSQVRHQYGELALATSITGAGQAPFHLHIDAEISDLAGNLLEKATVEEWWASPSRYRVEFTSASLHIVNSSLSSEVKGPLATRSRYLLDKLLTEVTQPLPPLQEKEVLQQIHRNVAGVPMTCIGVGYVEPNGRFFCSDSNHQLRMVQTDQSVTVRNHLGKFHDNTVPVSIAITYLGHEAVSGDVAVLQGFNPEKSSLLEFTDASSPDQGSPHGKAPQATSAGVTAGHKTGGQAPVYPEGAKRAHITGQVVLCAVISPDGRVTETAVIATSSPLLSQAATDAVKTWTYLPFRLNGTATQVVSTVTVNFNIQ